MTRLKLFAVLGCVLVSLAARSESETHATKLDVHLRRTLDQLRGGASLEQLRSQGAPLTFGGDLDVFIVGPATRAQLQAAGARVRTSLPGLATADLPIRAVNALVRLPGVRRIEAAVPVEPQLEVSVPLIDADKQRGGAPDFPGLNGAGVLVGSVDTGVDYGHDDFRNPDGSTRFVSIWDQTDTTGPGSPPSAPYNYGRECSPASINAATCNERDLNATGHGTHVLGIAAGDGSATPGGPPLYIGVAPKADLIHVKVDFSSNAKIVDGVGYIMSTATSLGKNAVVNLSLGTQRGPHDGTSAFEAMLNALTGPGRIVVVAAGNDGLTQVHAEVVAGDPITSGTVRMHIAGGAPVASTSINGYYDAPAAIDVTLYPPDGSSAVGPVHLGQVYTSPPGSCGTSWGCATIENGVNLTATGSREVIITIQASIAASTGDWGMQFTPVDLAGTSGRVDLWRYHIAGEPASTFCDPYSEVGCPPPAPARLIIEPGNAVDVITVAAWTSKQSWTACDGLTYSFPGTSAVGNLAPFSSPGPTRDGRQKPDIAAPGAAIASAMSQDQTPVCPVGVVTDPVLPDGMLHRMNYGTSMATPHVTGAAALLMQKFGAVTPAFIKSWLAGHAAADGFTGAVPNFFWGSGKMKVGDLANPTAQVLAPNGGQTLSIGSPTTLNWSSTDLHPETYGGVTSVDLLLSRNGVNGSYATLFTAIPNTGSKIWTITGPATTQAFLKVVARDAAGNIGSDISDAAFTIRSLCSVCQGSYCSGAGERCNAVTACMSGGCCQYTCVPDNSCTTPDPIPDNACGGN